MKTVNHICPKCRTGRVFYREGESTGACDNCGLIVIRKTTAPVRPSLATIDSRAGACYNVRPWVLLWTP